MYLIENHQNLTEMGKMPPVFPFALTFAFSIGFHKPGFQYYKHTYLPTWTFYLQCIRSLIHSDLFPVSEIL